MATVSAVILKHHKKQDDTWNVKIRVGHKTKSAYIDTPHFVTQKQIDKHWKLKDPYVIDRVAITLKKYRDKISDHAEDIEEMSVQDIKHLLLHDPLKVKIDFVQFAREITSRRKDAGMPGWLTFQTVTNALLDFTGGTLPIKDLTSKFLERYEVFLRSKQGTNRRGVTDAGLHAHMRDLRTMFNLAKAEYNDEDRGIIVINHNPFKVYKAPQLPLTTKRNLSVEQIIKLRDLDLPDRSDIKATRDLFMLSFYLCGMNLKDMYNIKEGAVERVEYCRSKTASRRKDKAFISIKLPNEAMDLYDQYAGNIEKMLGQIRKAQRQMSAMLRKLEPMIGVDRLTFYHARHTFATMARNNCRFSKDDVALALNHADPNHSTTDIYIARDWSIIDEVQASVIALLTP